jgi:hypothetical protein
LNRQVFDRDQGPVQPVPGQSPEVTLELVRSLIHRVRELPRGQRVGLLDVYGRSGVALELATNQDGKLVVERLTQQDMASRGAARAR